MRETTYITIKNIDKLLELLTERRGKLVAGGLDIMLKIKHGQLSADTVFDISEIKELSYIYIKGGYLHIGPCATLKEVLENNLVQKFAPLLVDYVGQIGSMEVRNIGTIGGNLCISRANCGVCFLPGCKAMTSDRTVPPCRYASYSDTLLPLVAYKGIIVISSLNKQRMVNISEFLNERMLSIKSNEVLSDILIDTIRNKNFGVAEFRQPKKMGFPYISVIAQKNDDSSYDIVIGGAMKQIYQFNNTSRDEISDICCSVDFIPTLRYSVDYMKNILQDLVYEAIIKTERK